MVAVLDSQFWNKLSQISGSVGLKPEDLLAVMYYESGLNPAAHNANGDASGLIQFMPGTLDAVGFKGNPADFRQLNADKQLDYVSRYVADKAKVNNGDFKSAAQYYVANLWPVALTLPGVRNEDPNTIIIEQNPTHQKYPGVSLDYERAAYRSNASLDVDHDGKITYGDLQAVMNNVKRTKGYQNAVAQLSSGNDVVVGKAPANQEVAQRPSSAPGSSVDEDKLSEIETMLNALWKAVAKDQVSKRCITKIAYRQLLPNPLLIKVQSNNYDTSIEFARLLSLALEEEMLADSTICADPSSKAVEIACTINGPRQLSINATLQLCDTLSNLFEKKTAKIGFCKVQTIICPNQVSSYQQLGIKEAIRQYDIFHYKFKEMS
jgi:Transglycosylase SLT domain